MSELMLGAAAAPAAATAQAPPRAPPDAAPSDPAFAAILASLGHSSLQTPAQQGVQPAASLRRLPAEGGNIVPFRPAAAGQPATASAFIRAMSHPGAEPRPLSAAAPAAHTTDVAWKQELALGDTAFQRFTARGFAPFDARPATPVMPAAAAAALLDSDPATLSAPSLTGTGAEIAPGSGVATSGASPSAVAVTAIDAHPQHPRFAETLSRQVTVMAGDGIQQARISINPPELGPVELRITVRNDDAVVHLAATSPLVREALEDALPRLREQFAQAGMNLSDSGVFSELPRESRDRDAGAAGVNEDVVADDGTAASLAAVGEVPAHGGFIDAFV